MSVIATFSVPASEFVLGKALRETAVDLTIEVERVVPTGSATIPYFWVIGESLEEFDAVLSREPAIESFRVVDELDDRSLYRLDWDAGADTIVTLIADHDLVLQEAGGDTDSWEFQIRVPDSHALSEFHSACRELGIDLSVERLYNPVTMPTEDRTELTEAQRALLELALEEGYFEVPRKTTLVELSEELGISDQAVNERMRRGLQVLLSTTLQSGGSPVRE